jgi:hypothetical protein
MARPKADIDWKRVDELLEADCEGTEIAAHLGLVPDTLYKRCQEDNKLRFSDYLRQKKASGNTLLKEHQWKMATGKEDSQVKKSMLIWLGKQRLGQSDKKQQTLEISDKGTFNIHFRNGNSNPNKTTNVQSDKPEGD